MFGNKKNSKETNPVKKGIIPSAPSHALNTLVHGTVVEGTVSSDNDIRIDGTIKGALSCKAKIIIGPTGYVEGDIRCENAVIEGRFDGNLEVTGLLNVRESAKISGDVKTNKLIVQSGAVFNVACNMSKHTGNGTVDAPKTSKNIVQAAEKQKMGIKQEAR